MTSRSGLVAQNFIGRFRVQGFRVYSLGCRGLRLRGLGPLQELHASFSKWGDPNMEHGSFRKQGSPIWTPNYDSPYSRDPQKGIPDFGQPPHSLKPTPVTEANVHSMWTSHPVTLIRACLILGWCP